MTTYSGPATAITPDGAEIPTTARLHIDTTGQLKSWGGSLDIPGGDDRWALINAAQGTLRMPDGREGQFIASYSVAASAAATVEFLSIVGSGEAPF